MRNLTSCIGLVLAVACGGPGDPPEDGGAGDAGSDAATLDAGAADAGAADAGPTVDAGSEPDASAPDAGPVVPGVAEVLDCGRTGAGGLARAMSDDALQRHDLSLEAFPDALCNDGRGAAFYFRPHVGEENRHRWLLQLQGGGGCGDAQSCANRWCRVETNFGMNTMTTEGAPELAIDGRGLMARADDNPYAGWNQVFVKYCSSDGWAGSARDVDVDALHPVNGDPVRIRFHFLGRRIVEAVVATLRREDGVLAYDGGASPTEMDDLDDAVELAFAGGSAGGNGVISNLDWLAGQLGGVQMHGVIDSAFQPELAELDYSVSRACTEGGACDYESFQRAAADNRSLQDLLPDASCVAAHAADPWRCVDNSHVIRNHLTTPFFVRMGLTDSLVSSGFIDAGLGVPGTVPFDLPTFAQTVRRDLIALGRYDELAEEGASAPVLPGVFGISCPEHETLRNNPHIYDATVRFEGVDYTFMEVLRGWLDGVNPRRIVTDSPSLDGCPE